MNRANIFQIASLASVVWFAVAARSYSQDVRDVDAAVEDEAAAESATNEEAAGEQDIAATDAPIDGKWLEVIDRMGGDSFADRKRAADELIGGGVEAMAALEYGLDQQDIEVRERCIDLLRKATKSADLDVRERARTALLRKSIPIVPKQPDPNIERQLQMAALQRRFAQNQAAQRQRQIQQPPQLVPGPPRIGNQIMPGAPGIRPPGGLVPGPGAIQSSVTVRETNGVRDIEVVQNGTKVTAKQLADGSITGEVTKSVDGKETTEKFSAKNIDELATKSPEAAERLTKALKTLDENKAKVPGR